MVDKPITAAHDEVETLKVDVKIPEHVERGSASATFTKTRLQLIDREGGRCWVCGRTEEESGHPLEAHHHPIERCFAEEIDWHLFAAHAKLGHWGPHAAAFDWDGFFVQGAAPATDGQATLAVASVPKDIYLFVDDMNANGMLLCKDHHTVGDEGIHTLPFPIYLAQKYAKEGTVFTDKEVIHHAV